MGEALESGLSDAPKPSGKDEEEQKPKAKQEAPKPKPTQEKEEGKDKDYQKEMMDDLLKFTQDFNKALYGDFYDMLGNEADKAMRSLKDSFSKKPGDDKEDKKSSKQSKDDTPDMDEEEGMEMQDLSSSSDPMQMTSGSDTITSPTSSSSGLDSMNGLNPDTIVETVEANPELLMAL
ncbi:hypothetical protein [Legionella cardiaca]|uniref:Uncharacterized protein n=1 Tax=Legionella cardiaca TaxID=1071983 RepID=A0ABY8AQU8_9GAMM|nr:hypothetical protein [Legionella cardiaca]WED43052.1 hypothetical protein PXX05_14315 [Legionella cardiaca]